MRKLLKVTSGSELPVRAFLLAFLKRINLLLILTVLLAGNSCKKEPSELTSTEFIELKHTLDLDKDVLKAREYFFEFSQMSASFPPSEFQAFTTKLKSCGCNINGSALEMTACLNGMPGSDRFVNGIDKINSYRDLTKLLKKRYPQIERATKEQRAALFTQIDTTQLKTLLDFQIQKN